jgi:hypothetical protein
MAGQLKRENVKLKRSRMKERAGSRSNARKSRTTTGRQTGGDSRARADAAEGLSFRDQLRAQVESLKSGSGANESSAAGGFDCSLSDSTRSCANSPANADDSI